MKTMKRKYELKKRAQRLDETRQRIVEAAVELHEHLGPAQTSISAIAESAGVGRPTVYRHFPDERSLFSACTAHYLDQHRVPDWDKWRAVIDPRERLRIGLVAIYRWYRETEQMSSVTFRDLPEIPVLAEVLEPHFAGFAAARAILSEGWSASNPGLLDAAIGHALDFSTWRSLARDHRIDDETVADLMTSMVVAAAQPAVASAA